ncbi:MAG: LCP family protein [Firmicutes bacterium]|nr:LCP family protein [Bacillota bacterium]
MNESGSGADSSGIRPKKIRIWFTAILLVLVMLICAAVAVLMPLYQAYRKSHMDVPIVTRPDESYTRPPEPTFDPDPTAPDDTDSTDPSGTTEPPVTEPDDTEPADTTHPPVKVPGIYKVDKKDPDIENILILGTDSRNVQKERGRSDSIIVASFNKRTKQVKLVSFLRDTYIPIEGHGWNRINAAYAVGGVALCVNTINDLFGLDIQKFVIVNFSGASTFVDACGGVDMALTQKEINYLLNLKDEFPQNSDGTYHLDGKVALDYMRMRKIDSDFGRTERQRKTMMAIYSQAMARKDVTQMYNLVREGFNLVKTNLKLSEMLDLAQSVISMGSELNIGSESVPPKSTKKLMWSNRYIDRKSVLWIENLDDAKKYVVAMIYGN